MYITKPPKRTGHLTLSVPTVIHLEYDIPLPKKGRSYLRFGSVNRSFIHHKLSSPFEVCLRVILAYISNAFLFHTAAKQNEYK